MPEETKEKSAEDLEKARREFIEKMRRANKIIGTFTITEMVGQKDVEEFIRMIQEAQKNAHSKDFKIGAPTVA